MYIIILGTILFLSGLAMSIAGYLIHQKDNETCTEQVTATCIACREESNLMRHSCSHRKEKAYSTVVNAKAAASNSTYYGIFQYEYNGQLYNYIDKSGSKYPISIGETVSLYVNPYIPSQTAHTGTKKLILLGIITTLAGIVMVLTNM